MKKIYFLSTCNTCTRIMKALNITDDFVLQDIKTQPITEEDLAEMRKRTDSYESLFSKRSRQYRSRGLHEVKLKEDDLKALILEEYTFLKRPVIIIDEDMTIGNAKKEVERAAELIDAKG